MAGLPGPGDRIEARCTRCNDITGHVIVALVGGEIVKVECRACGSVHKYYPPATPKEAKGKTAVCRVKAGETRKEAVNSFKPTSTPSTAAASPAAVSRAAAKAQKAAEDMEQNWQRTMNMTAASARPYAMNESFAVGDVIDHPKFGSGVVQEIFPPDKKPRLAILSSRFQSSMEIVNSLNGFNRTLRHRGSHRPNNHFQAQQYRTM